MKSPVAERARQIGLGLMGAVVCSGVALASRTGTGNGGWIVHPWPGGGGAVGVAMGPEHRGVWFAGYQGTAHYELMHARIDGRTQSYRLGSWEPSSIALGADGRLYMASPCCSGTNGAALVAVTLTGQVSPYLLPRSETPNDGVALGPDGNIWFTTTGTVGKVTPSGQITEYANPPGYYNTNAGISTGIDGRIWFPLNTRGSGYFAYAGLGYVDPYTGATSAFPFKQCYYVEPIVAGTDGNIYAGCQTPGSGGPKLVQITPTGALTFIPDPNLVDYSGGSVMVATSGKIWFIDWGHTNLSELDTKTHRVLQHPPQYPLASLDAIGLGPDGNIWAGGSGASSFGAYYGVFIR